MVNSRCTTLPAKCEVSRFLGKVMSTSIIRILSKKLSRIKVNCTDKHLLADMYKKDEIQISYQSANRLIIRDKVPKLDSICKYEE